MSSAVVRKRGRVFKLDEVNAPEGGDVERFPSGKLTFLSPIPLPGCSEWMTVNGRWYLNMTRAAC